jgi:hypothetical protein
VPKREDLGRSAWVVEIKADKNQHHFLEGGNSIAVGPKQHIESGQILGRLKKRCLSKIVVDLKGKILEYLKAHEISLHFNTKSKGNFEIKPKVLFVDELGKYRSYEF